MSENVTPPPFPEQPGQAGPLPGQSTPSGLPSYPAVPEPGPQPGPGFPGGYGGPGYGGLGFSSEVPLWLPLYGASLAQAWTRFWKKYATFSGRASRSEYWWWALIAAVIGIVLSSLRDVGGGGGSFFDLVDGLWGLATIVPSLALLWRRLHDTDRSGLWALAPIVLGAVGSIVLAFGAIIALANLDSGSSGGYVAASVLFAIGGLILLVGGVIVLVLTLLRSKPEGARFDRPPFPPYQPGFPPAPGAYYPQPGSGVPGQPPVPPAPSAPSIPDAPSVPDAPAAPRGPDEQPPLQPPAPPAPPAA